MTKLKQQLVLIVLIIIILALHCTAHAQTKQTVSGLVFDEASRKPLAGALVILIDSAMATGTASNGDGTYFLTGVPLGRQSFKVSYTGYEDRLINDVLVTAGKEVVLNIGLQEALHKLEEVTISYNKAKDKTRTNNDMAQVSARSFNVDETKRYAGSLGDPSRMAANFAGVASGNDATNEIVVRGNSPTGMLWQLEGINIPNPNHYGSLNSTGGPISMMNNNNIDKSDFMTSAFPAQYGNAVAGVFDIKLRDGNRNKSEFLGQIGFNGFELGAEGPLGKNKKTTYLANYRYSTLGVFQKMGISFGTGSATPYYQDLNFKITSQLSKKSTLKVFGIGGLSSIDFLGKDIDTTKAEMYSGDPYSNERNNYATNIAGASYEYRITDRTYTRFTAGYSTTSERYERDSLSPVDYKAYPRYKLRSGTSKMTGMWAIHHKIDARNNVEAGITYDYTTYNVLNKAIYEGVTEEVFYDSKGNYGLAQGFVQWKHRFSSKLSAVGGLHSQYLDVNSSAALEPRASARYTLNARQAVSLGYGLHHQAQNIYTYHTRTTDAAGNLSLTNKDLGFTRSHHFVATYDWNITSNLRLKAEAYYQLLGNVPVEQRSSSFSTLNFGGGFDIADADSLTNTGKGSNYGTELTLERFFNNGYFFLVTTSLFQSKYQGSDGIVRNTAFNMGHVANVLGGKEFKVGKKGNVLALNLRLSHVGGRYLTPIDLERSISEGTAYYQQDRAFSQKQKDYFRTDLRIAYRKEYRRSTLELAIDLQNLTNNQNIFNQYFDAKKGTIVTTYQQSFFPVPMVRFTF